MKLYFLIKKFITKSPKHLMFEFLTKFFLLDTMSTDLVEDVIPAIKQQSLNLFLDELWVDNLKEAFNEDCVYLLTTGLVMGVAKYIPSTVALIIKKVLSDLKKDINEVFDGNTLGVIFEWTTSCYTYDITLLQTLLTIFVGVDHKVILQKDEAGMNILHWIILKTKDVATLDHVVALTDKNLSSLLASQDKYAKQPLHYTCLKVIHYNENALEHAKDYRNKLSEAEVRLIELYVQEGLLY